MEISSIRCCTFKRYERLKLRKDIRNVYVKGNGVQNSYFVILYLENGLEYSRYAFSDKKKFGKAVRRNKVKRWMREVIRTNKNIIPKGNDYLIIVRKMLSKNFLSISFEEFKEKLLELFERISNEKNSIVND